MTDPDSKVSDDLDDGVAHVRDQNSQGWNGQQGPEDEEGLSRIGLGKEISKANSEQRGVSEVEGLEIAPFLVSFRLLENCCSSKPQSKPNRC